MMPELRPWTRQEMMKRVAFFKDLKGSKGGLPDSDLPECERELINVIGFQPPKEESAAVSPVGAESSRNSAIPISEGFNLGFARAKPGCGPLMHNHNTRRSCPSRGGGASPGMKGATTLSSMWGRATSYPSRQAPHAGFSTSPRASPVSSMCCSSS